MRAPLPTRPFVYPIVDVGLLGTRRMGDAVAALARGGARLLQVRAKDVPAGRFLALAREALAAAEATGAQILINDRPDVARILGAAGVHVGQDDLAPRDVRALLPPPAIVGLSTHALEEVEASKTEPIDYLAIGPVFATASKADPHPVVGLEMVRRARDLTSRPLVAIGGITRRNARLVIEAGADGLAVISDLLSAASLEEAVRDFRAALGDAS